MNLSPLSNTAILCFVLGWQGGTIHQVAAELEVETDTIRIADSMMMGELCRLAQRRGTHRQAPSVRDTASLISKMAYFIRWLNRPEEERKKIAEDCLAAIASTGCRVIS